MKPIFICTQLLSDCEVNCVCCLPYCICHRYRIDARCDLLRYLCAIVPGLTWCDVARHHKSDDRSAGRDIVDRPGSKTDRVICC